MQLDMHDRAKNAAALRIREQDMEKVQGTIKQFVRDWSAGVRLTRFIEDTPRSCADENLWLTFW